jgi:signal transduction histidine kinase
MAEILNFETDAAIINRLGRELVAKQETALIELIKNSFDAEATEVKVVFSADIKGGNLEIRDNGSGMSREELLDGFLRLASDLKVKSPRSPQFKRQRAGRKGIGRFATQRLGDRLTLTTKRKDDEVALKLTVDWTKFVAGSALRDVPVELETISAPGHGTSIKIDHLFDEWTDSQIRRCWRGVLALQQPFPVAPVESSPNKDPGFTVQFLRENELYKDEVVVADLQSEILDYLHAVVELQVDGEGRAHWRISKNQFGETFDWKPINASQPESTEPAPYKHLKNAWMKSHYVILDPTLLPSLVFTRVRDELSQRGGVRLYRNGFRVVPYGEPDNDWLHLDETYVKRSVLAPIANRNFFGVVEVRDPDGALFEEHTSREGLIETPALAELVDLVSSVLITAAVRISEERGRKPKASSKPPFFTNPKSEIEKIETVLQATRQAAEKAVVERTASAIEETVLQAKHAVEVVEAAKLGIVAAQEQLADEASMLRFLATLGMTTAEFSHETGMTFDAFRFDFDTIFSTALMARSRDNEFIKQADRAKAMLSRLDTLTSYLNTLAGARAARGMRPISLSKVVEDFELGIKQQAEAIGVELKVKVPAFDPLFTRPMHEAELASMLLNFYTNAIKALKRSENQRSLLISACRDEADEQFVKLQFSDSGDGVPEEHKERIFDAFFTTRISSPGSAPDTEHARGTGLGLWIVSQIVTNAGGEVYLTTPPNGYSTCIEVLLPAEEEHVG